MFSFKVCSVLDTGAKNAGNSTLLQSFLTQKLHVLGVRCEFMT